MSSLGGRLRSLGGRIGLVLLVFALATLIAVGGALWVSLRDLYREAALGSLANLTLPYASQARRQFPLELMRPVTPGERPGPEQQRRFRDSLQGQLLGHRLADFVSQAQDELDAAGVAVLVLQDGTVVRDREPSNPTTAGTAVAGSPVVPDIRVPERFGSVATGSTVVEGLGEVLYAATPALLPREDRAIPALVLVRPDDSARLASEDLVRALAIAGLLLILIGIPLALGLSRSVTGPLRRLAFASHSVARGEVPGELPTSGPVEVADATAAFNSMTAEVTATREAQRQLLADIRHDLRTPVTVIAGFAQALGDGTATGPSADRAAEAIRDEAGRLGRMLDDLDHLTMPGSGGPALRLETLDGRALAQETVTRFAAQAEERDQRLAVADGAGPAWLLADRDAAARILANLVANALAHAPSPGGSIELEVGDVDPADPPVGEPGGWAGRAGVLLAVRDDGPGIPAGALAHVFDRFYRADASRSGPGSGLGLAIVRDLVDAMGGRAFAENLAGKGARVGVVIPAAPQRGAVAERS